MQQQQQQHQRHPQQKQAAAAAAAAVEKQVFGPTLIRAGAKDRHPCFVLRQSQSMPRRNRSIRREEHSIAITADLHPFVTHTGLTVKTALFVSNSHSLVIHEGSPPQFPCRTSTGGGTRRPLFFVAKLSFNHSNSCTHS